MVYLFELVTCFTEDDTKITSLMYKLDIFIVLGLVVALLQVADPQALRLPSIDKHVIMLGPGVELVQDLLQPFHLLVACKNTCSLGVIRKEECPQSLLLSCADNPILQPFLIQLLFNDFPNCSHEDGE